MEVEKFSEKLWQEIKTLLIPTSDDWSMFWGLRDLKRGFKEHQYFPITVREKGKLQFVHIMEFIKYPRCEVLDSFYAVGKNIVGNQKVQLELDRVQKELASIRQAKYIQIRGRHGWQPVLRKHGYWHRYSTFIQRIDNGNSDN